jgi:hypothetical protein
VKREKPRLCTDLSGFIVYFCCLFIVKLDNGNSAVYVDKLAAL